MTKAVEAKQRKEAAQTREASKAFSNIAEILKVGMFQGVHAAVVNEAIKFVTDLAEKTAPKDDKLVAVAPPTTEAKTDASAP